MRKIFTIATAVATVTCLGMVTAIAATAAVKPAYSSLPKPAVPNLPSVGVEAYSFNQIGDQVKLAGKARHLTSVEVTMSDWACQSGGSGVTTADPNSNCLTDPGSHFNTPITISIYRAAVAGDGATGERVPGALIKTITRTFAIPFRPSASVKCSNTTYSNPGGYYDKTTNDCYHGLAHIILFNHLSRLGVTLPNRVVYAVSYNSDTSGPKPLGGSNSPTDSLNVGLSPAVTAGAQVTHGGIWWDTRVASFSDGLPSFVPGVLNLDGPSASPANWDELIPAVQINAS